MRSNYNRHGPDIDIGVWYAALLRHSDAVTDDSDAGISVRAGPEGVGWLIPAWKQEAVETREDPRLPGYGFQSFELFRQRSTAVTQGEISDCGFETGFRHKTPVPRPASEEWPPGNTMHQKQRRRRRSTIVNGRTGESPPGTVRIFNINKKDSKARSRLRAKGRILTGSQAAMQGARERYAW